MQPYKHIALQSNYSDAKPQIEDNFRRRAAGHISGTSMSYELPATKLLTKWDEYTVSLGVRASQLSAGWPATTYLDAFPLLKPSGSADNPIVITDISWICTDTGAGTGDGYVGIEVWDGSTPAWGSIFPAFARIFTLTNGAKTGAQGLNVVNAARNIETGDGEYDMTLPMCLVLYANTADATALSAAGSFFRVDVRVKQVIRSA